MDRTYSWQDPSPLARASAGVLSATFLAKCASCAVWGFFGEAAAYTGKETALSQTQWIRWFVDMAMFSLIVASIVLVFWLVRVSKNAHSVKPDMRFSPAWTVGWYLIPIMSLFKPFEAMVEIWDVSASPQAADRTPVGLWWASLIASNLLGAFYMIDRSPWSGLLFELSGAVAALLSLQLVQRLSAMQVEKHGGRASGPRSLNG